MCEGGRISSAPPTLSEAKGRRQPAACLDVVRTGGPFKPDFGLNGPRAKLSLLENVVRAEGVEPSQAF
jgi:hypothetical protein